MRVILDTNLWSYLGDDGSIRALEAALVQRDVQLLVPPSTLLEIVDIPHETVRKRIITGLGTGARRTRLRTEADSYASEVVALIKRTNPRWMRQISNPGPPARLRTFWLKKVWAEALHDSTRLHDYQTSQKPTHDIVLGRQKYQRSELLRTKFEKQLLEAPLTTIEITADDPSESLVPGWDGQPVTAWRANLTQLTWYNLGVVGPRALFTKEDRTMTDWVEPFVDLARMRRDADAFGRMWLEEAHIEEVPRNWLSWAVDVVQWTQKITSGNPADAQHAAYLLDCDRFLTADRPYVRVLERVRQDAPFEFAATCLVSADSSVSAAERIAEALAQA